MRKVIKPNSPEAFAICRRIRDENGFGKKHEQKERETKPRKPKTKITEEIIKRVYELSDEGLSASKVANRIGISKATAARIRAARRKHYE